MTKKEYLKNLKDSLKDLDLTTQKNQINNYKSKINDLIKSGMSEQSALKKIGSVKKVSSSIKNDIIKVDTIKTEVSNTPLKKKQKVTKLKNQKEILPKEEKLYNTVLKEMSNLIFLIVTLVLLYFPFNMVNINIIKSIQFFSSDLKYIYLASTIIYSIYLIICVVSFSHYLSYITGNVNVNKINIIFSNSKKILLKILLIPSVILMLLSLQLLIVAAFFYLDGLRVKGISILCLGVLLFSVMFFVTLRNSVREHKKSIFYSFYMYIVPLLFICFGAVLTYKEMDKYEYISDINSKYVMKLSEFSYNLPDEDEKFKIYFNTNYNTKYTIKYDEKLSDSVRLEITYYKDYYEINETYDKNGTYISLSANCRRKISLFLNNIKENQILNYDEIERYEVIIYVSKKNEGRLIIEN